MAQAQTNLGSMLINGWGTARDPGEAARWWRKAADQGFAEAQSNLGRMYAYGDGVPRDYGEAMKWLAVSEVALKAAVISDLVILTFDTNGRCWLGTDLTGHAELSPLTGA